MKKSARKSVKKPVKKSAKKPMRSDTEILKDLIDAVLEHEYDRDCEIKFYERRGFDPEYWEDDDKEWYKEVIMAIEKSRVNVQSLLREATGDTKMRF